MGAVDRNRADWAVFFVKDFVECHKNVSLFVCNFVSRAGNCRDAAVLVSV